MWVKKYFALIIGKLILASTRVLRVGGGSAAPGLYALKIYPHLLEDLSKQIPQHVVVTGTNGKTTTARLLNHFAEKQGLRVLRNATGSNLERGIASALISGWNITFKKYDLAIWELDEAAFNTTVLKVNPQTIIFLNAFRDQLDRYGEVDSVIKKWCTTLNKINPKTNIIINGDDLNLLQLKKCFTGKSIFFGVKDYKIQGERVIKQQESENLNYQAKDIKTTDVTQSSFMATTPHDSLKVNLPLSGVYNIYNFLASLTAAELLGIEAGQVISSLNDFVPAFGRMEKLNFEGKEGYIFLIKNPAGATQVFQTIAPILKKDDRLWVSLNDNFADGTDVSWIWDANFEELNNKNTPYNLLISGQRADDLALRFKYAGFDKNLLDIEPDPKSAFRKAKADLKGRLFILPTYTCLLELQKILSKQKIKKDYWREI